jgi:hypothetical protein
LTPAIDVFYYDIFPVYSSQRPSLRSNNRVAKSIILVQLKIRTSI